MSRCKGCRAEISWAITATGRRMPVDPQPVADGNVVWTGKWHPSGARVVAVLADGEEPPAGRQRYVSHFATCPKAGTFR